ncbi:MAG: 5-formyltetrahydrofolate cyclo-ligase [Mogibacterium sp.]|nr:5-formyltetrahydrofolate cyclo-ligase [Mogibacterium sp.]
MSSRKEIRKQGIAAREGLTDEERVGYSGLICDAVRALPEYRNAKTILSYKWTKGEVRLTKLETYAKQDGKTLCFPLCVSDTEMVAIEPGKGRGAWRKGAYGIKEPVAAAGVIAGPQEIDLVICPCSTFDEECNRMGMGAGYYDRYLPKCTNAAVIAVAFEAQKSEALPVNEWDKKMEAVVTESAVYRAAAPAAAE